MIYSRRDFGKIALASIPGAALLEKTLLAQAKPNSVFGGVQVGTITYSYRQMPDQSAKALLGYIVSNGISAVELMGQPAEQFAGAPVGNRGGGGGGGGRGPGGPPPERGAAPERGAGGDRGGGRGGRGNNPPSPEQQAAQREARENLRKWRTSVSMDKYKELRKLYNDAGVKIYGLKISPNPDMTDDEMDYVFNAGAAVGATHVTLELTDNEDFLRRCGQFAEKHKVYCAFHSHTQGGFAAFDKAFATSKAIMSNVDFGHYVAGGNVGGSTLQFLKSSTTVLPASI